MRNRLWVFCTIISLISTGVLQAQNVFQADKGWLNAREWSAQSRPLQLNGGWLFYENVLLTPEQAAAGTPASVLHVPQTWKNGEGYGTYVLRLVLPHNRPDLGVEIPQLYNSYQLWAGSQLIASNGQVGNSAATAKPYWLPQTVSLPASGDTVLLTLQVANFHHRTGGIREPILLGATDTLRTKRSWELGTSLAQACLLVMEGLAFVVLFLQERKKRMMLYFGLLCITWALRALFSNLYIGVHLMPDLPWALVVKTEYLTLFFAMIWSLLLVAQLFPTLTNKLIRNILVIINLVFAAIAIITSPLIFTQWLNVYLAVVGIVIVYAVYIIFRALLHDQRGVWPLIASILMGILMFAYDLIAYKGVLPLNMLVLNIGYIAIFIFLTITLLIHLEVIKVESSSTMLTYDDMYGKKDK